MTRIALYTCVTGGYDHVLPPASTDPRISYHAWSDRPDTLPAPWQAHLANIPGLDAKDTNRYIKMHPHLLPELADVDVSIYIDGSIHVIGDVHGLVTQCLDQAAEMFIYDHPFRRCAYDEAAACAGFGHAHLLTLKRQFERYRASGFPRQAGLYECNVLIRRHSPTVARTMDLWWNEYRQFAKRDQLSITWAAWTAGLAIASLGPSDPRHAQRVFQLKEHAKAGFSAKLTGTKWWNRLLRACGRVALPNGS
jgi:hypothetical protein